MGKVGELALRRAYSSVRFTVAKYVGAHSPLGAAVARLRGRFVASKLAKPITISNSWVIALGWSTSIERNTGERSPRETLCRSGVKAPDVLYLDGLRLPSLDVGWHEIERLRAPYTSRVLVAAPFTDSIYVVPQGPMPASEADFRDFRNFPAMEFARPASRHEDPREMREHQLLRWTDPHFFHEKVVPFRESVVGWGTNGAIDSRPIANTYESLYYVSMIARETGADSRRAVVEIGGGFGNLARVAAIVAPDLFATHTIIDLPDVVRLQHWFLNQEFAGEVAEPNCTDHGRFRFVDVDHLDRAHWTPDIVVATRSLSELDPAQVNLYLDRVVLPSRLALFMMERQFWRTPITYHWMIRRMIDDGFTIRRLDALYGRNVVAGILAR